MYSQDDLNTAVAAGAISAEAATALRAHVAQKHATPTGDEENFRLLTGFNDIFVSIGVVILLMAVGAIGQTFGDASGGGGPEAVFAGAFIAGPAWMLAEFFTRKRRMALPSILLLLAFVGGVAATLIGTVLTVLGESDNDRLVAALFAGCALVTAGAAWVHWRRFMVPITVAAGTAALAATAIGLIVAAVGPERFDDNGQTLLVMVLVAGLAVFGFAMKWDGSDRTRVTRRSDVAFWLHLLAAPMIAHPIFSLIGITQGDSVGIGGAVAVVAVYVVFGLVALAVDRRALLVSALAYVLIALTLLFREFGAVELNFALTALVIVSALLTLSALWTPIRRSIVAALPSGLQNRLPATA